MYVVHVLTCVERDADRRSRSHSASSKPRRPPWTYWHLQWRCLWYLLSTWLTTKRTWYPITILRDHQLTFILVPVMSTKKSSSYGNTSQNYILTETRQSWQMLLIVDWSYALQFCKMYKIKMHFLDNETWHFHVYLQYFNLVSLGIAMYTLSHSLASLIAQPRIANIHENVKFRYLKSASLFYTFCKIVMHTTNLQ